MNVLIIDVDSRIPNLALKKVEYYHEQRGDVIVWNLPIFRGWADAIYVSCIFRENREKCLEWEGDSLIGGSGYDLSVKLPPEIEAVRPHINLGFSTRGCIRHCGFCVVPAKEGRLRIVGDLLDLWDGESREVIVMDNNILGLPGHFRRVCEQAQGKGIRIDFNQGLDHRLLTTEIAGILRATRHKEYRFAFDYIDQYDSVNEAIGVLHSAGINRSFWYVLVGYNTTLDEDLGRLEFLKGWGETVFVQRYRKTRGNLLLAQWANQHNLFKVKTFGEFLQMPKNSAHIKRHGGDKIWAEYSTY